MRTAMSHAARALRAFWRGLRQWSGDADYDRYLLSPGVLQAKNGVLSRKQFFLDQLRRRYSRPSRCC